MAVFASDSLGDRIKSLRMENNLTQKQLAEALNVTDKAVSKWERGLSFPDVSMLEPISDLLDISILELLEGSRTDPDKSLSQNEVQELIKGSVGLSEEEIRHRKQMSRFIIIFLVVLFLLLISITLNIISFLV